LKVEQGALIWGVGNQLTLAKLAALRFDNCESHRIGLLWSKSLALVWLMCGLSAAAFGLILSQRIVFERKLRTGSGGAEKALFESSFIELEFLFEGENFLILAVNDELFLQASLT